MAPAMPELQVAINDLLLKLQRRQVEGSFDTARLTVLLLRQVVSQQRTPKTGQAAGTLIEAVRSVGIRLIAANPIELAVGNIVRRILHIIREEQLAVASSTSGAADSGSDTDDYCNDDQDDVPSLSAAAVAAASRSALRAPSLYNLLESVPSLSTVVASSLSGGDSEGKSRLGDKNTKGWKLKHNVIEAINELLQEIDSYHTLIAEQALEHIHQNEVILTLGGSRTLLRFLCEAKKRRSFQVFIAEGTPRYEGHSLAKKLAAVDLQTTIITDSAVFAMISRVNLVIIGAHAVMANGGVIAPIGSHMVALAAHRHGVPFVVLAGLHKLCPVYPHNPFVLVNEMKSPSQIVDFGEMSECVDEAVDGVSLYVVNPSFDYIPPELVSLFITDTGGHNPSYVYRLVAEFYSPEDFVLQ